MYLLRFHKCIFILLLVPVEILNGEGFTFKNPIRFPYGGPFMGIFLALAIPLELPNSNVFVSYNFEGNYNLPQNQTEFQYPPIWGNDARSFFLDRKYVYNILEHKFESYGYPGKRCLLRTICEASEYSVEHNGILGELIHIVLTPSTSRSEGLEDYELAEQYGRTKKHCKKFVSSCKFSFLSLISFVDKVF